MPEVMVEVFRSSMMAKRLEEFKAKYGLHDQVKLIPANNDEVHAHRPRYCTLYAYRFTISYTFPLPPLVEEFCRFYRVWPVQIAPSSIK